MSLLALRGQTLAFRADPFETAPEDAVDFTADGAVIIEDGLIREVGPADDVLPRWPAAPVERFAKDLILAGFVDCHVHYPQTGVIASYGAQLLDWLNTYTFPEETRFADPDYARATATLFLDLLARNGTTSACAYCTSHSASVDALFEAAEARGLRMAAGKMMMDRHAPAALLDTPQSGYDDSAALIARWHGKGRAAYVVSPRFAPTSTPEQLEAAGALWRENPTTLMQTHISENLKEIAWVGELFPDAPDYLGVYERFGLIGPGANFGHAIHLAPRERALLAESGSGVSHCPTSNAFIGSGLFDMAGLRDPALLNGVSRPVPVGVATDVGGGSSFSMLQTLRSAYEIAQLNGYSLHPFRAFWLATMGSAKVMRLGDRVGALAAGYEADVIVVDPAATPVLAQRARRANDIAETLFALMILGDDRAIRRTYGGGRLIHDRDAA